MKRVRLWLCRHLDWHKGVITTWDGASFHGKCRICGRTDLLMDDLGDWF